MNPLSAFLALFQFFVFVCSAVPRTLAVGHSSVVLICALLCGATRLMALVVKMLFCKNQDVVGQAGQVLTALGERFRKYDTDVNIARAANKGKNHCLH